MFATRLQTVLSDVINEDHQSGYLKDCFIGENIRLFENITFFTMKHK